MERRSLQPGRLDDLGGHHPPRHDDLHRFFDTEGGGENLVLFQEQNVTGGGIGGRGNEDGVVAAAGFGTDRVGDKSDGKTTLFGEFDIDGFAKTVLPALGENIGDLFRGCVNRITQRP